MEPDAREGEAARFVSGGNAGRCRRRSRGDRDHALRLAGRGESDAGSAIICSLENLAETFALAETLGVDPALFLATAEGEPFDMRYAQLKGPMMLAREFPAAFPLRLARKDLALVLEDVGARVELPVVEATLAQFDRAVELGHGDEDASAVSLSTVR